MATISSLNTLATTVQTAVTALNDAIAAAQVEKINVDVRINYAPPAAGAAPGAMPSMQSSGVIATVSLPLPLPTV